MAGELLTQRPKISFNEREAKVYVVTKYIINAAIPGKYHAVEKFDMTSELNAILDKVYDKALEHAQSGLQLKKRTKIVFFTGNIDNSDVIMKLNSDFSNAGWITVLPWLVSVEQNDANIVDDLTKRKIELCDMLYVLNVNSEIDITTQKHIDYAHMLGKPVQYYIEIINEVM